MGLALGSALEPVNNQEKIANTEIARVEIDSFWFVVSPRLKAFTMVLGK